MSQFLSRMLQPGLEATVMTYALMCLYHEVAWLSYSRLQKSLATLPQLGNVSNHSTYFCIVSVALQMEFDFSLVMYRLDHIT